jgi:K+-sensing histidine kinase KdpD
MKRIALGVELWSGEAHPLILAAAQFAAEVHTPWMAIAVSDAARTLSRLTADQQMRVRQNSELVTSLGGTPFICESADIASTLLAAAMVHGADLLILGRPHHRGMISRLFAHEVSESVMSRAVNLPLLFIGTTARAIA